MGSDSQDRQPVNQEAPEGGGRRAGSQCREEEEVRSAGTRGAKNDASPFGVHCGFVRH